MHFVELHARRFASLSRFCARDWQIVVAAACMLPQSWLSLWTIRRRPFEWRESEPIGARDPRSRQHALRIARLVAIAVRFSPFPVTCLSRSLVLARILRRHRIDARLRIGVRIADGKLDAHAWVEADGAPLNDKPDIDRHFLPFHAAIATENFG